MSSHTIIRKPLFWIILAVFLAILALGAWGCYAANAMLQRDTIYDNVRVASLDLSGKSQAEAQEAITGYLADIQQETVKYSLDDKTLELSLTNVDYDCDVEAIAQEAYQFGRFGSWFQRVWEVYHTRQAGKEFLLKIDIDRETLRNEIASYAETNGFAIGDYTYELTEDTVIIRPSKPGEKIDLDALMDDFANKIQSADFDTISPLPISEVHFDRTDVDRLYDDIHCEPVDARYEERNGVMTGIEAQDGISFDLEEARRILSEEKEEYVIPITRKKAQYTLENLDQGMYKDLISIFTTNFSSDASRRANIQIAASKINNCVLAPGQVFSFNQVVGPRTAEAGYQNAHVYTANGVEDGLAGGICQVSSTLYNTVILADLEIVSRTNHSYTVSYVPLGLDATVSYGTIDFKFKNNMATPIKLKASVTSNSITISINGIKTDQNKVIKTRNEVLSKTPPPEKDIEDASLAPGKRVLKQSGQAGYTVAAYKDIYVNGQLVKTETLPKSNYVPLNTVYAVGKTAEATPKPEPTRAPQTPPPTPQPTQAPTPQPTKQPEPTQEPNPTETPANVPPSPSPDADL